MDIKEQKISDVGADLDAQWALYRELGKASVGACNCGVASPKIEDYMYACRYRALDQAMTALASQAPEATSLFNRKLDDLQQRGYEVIGRILHKDGEYALFDSSCRWLTKPQYQRLMHEQDGSLFSPQAPAVHQEPVGVVSAMPGTDGGFTICSFHGNKVPDAARNEK